MTVPEIGDEIERFFPPLGRHGFLDAEAVKRLVETIQPGRRCQGTVERAQNNTWRLRVTASLIDGKRSRRGITLPDKETADWVRDYISKAKLEKQRQHGVM